MKRTIGRTFLILENPIYVVRVRDFTEKGLQEDAGNGDITTKAPLLGDSKAKAIIKAKSRGIIAGVKEAVWFYNNHKLEIKVMKRNASSVKKGKARIIMLDNFTIPEKLFLDFWFRRIQGGRVRSSSIIIP